MIRIFTKPIALVLTAAFLVSGCASIVSKSSYPVYIRSNPAGADLTITDKRGKEIYRGTTPKEIRLKAGAGFFSKAEYQVKLSAPGFKEKIVQVDYKLNGWYFGNLIFGGVLGLLIIDPATGAMWRIVDPIVDETLIKKARSTNTTATTTEAPSLTIINIVDASKEIKSKMVKIN